MVNALMIRARIFYALRVNWLIVRARKINRLMVGALVIKRRMVRAPRMNERRVGALCLFNDGPHYYGASTPPPHPS